ncbi:bifunctional DNA primase/polymerase, partial [Mariniblastus sp.]|nr:bifunctional DNA primase/polymerase [Mariniblastus sp.]
FSDWPNANVGVVLGPKSGIVDIEFDDEEGEATADELLAGISTPTYSSNRSTHRLFLPPEGIEGLLAVTKVHGLEVRLGTDGKGAQSVFPPSIHQSGDVYRWVEGLSPEDVKVAPFPVAVLKLLLKAAADKKSKSRKTKPKKQKCNSDRLLTDRDRLTLAPDQLELCLSGLPVGEYRDHDQWLSIMMASHHATAGEGLEEFVRWCTSDPQYARESITIAGRWESLDADAPGGITGARLLAELSNRGRQGIIDQLRGNGSTTLAGESAAKVDPSRLAAEFIAANTDKGGPSYCRWRGEWYSHKQGRYVAMTNEEFRNEVVVAIDNKYCKVTKVVLNNVLLHLEAKLNVPTDKPHNWIGEPLLSGAPSDILCFADAIGSIESLANGETIPATPRFFNVNATKFSYRARTDAGEPKRWLKFLKETLTVGSIKTLQQFFGYCLTQDTRQQKAMMLVGPKRSGKGTILRTLAKLVGTANTVSPSLSSLSGEFGRQPLIGKQLAIISDARIGKNSNALVETLLSIIGEDDQTINRKFLSAWSGRLPTRFIVAANEFPRVIDASGAFASRFIIMETPHSKYGREDLGLEDTLNVELAAIWWWAFDGLRSLQDSGRLQISKRSRKLANEFESLGAPIMEFLKGNIKLTGDPKDCILTDELFTGYGKWAATEGVKFTPTKAIFVRDLKTAAAKKLKLVDGRRQISKRRHKLLKGLRWRAGCKPLIY